MKTTGIKKMKRYFYISKLKIKNRLFFDKCGWEFSIQLQTRVD